MTTQPEVRPTDSGWRVQLAGVVTALVIAMIALALYQGLSMERELCDNARLQAAIVAQNAAAPMMFNDRQAAQETLSALRILPYIRSVAILDKDAHVFALYGPEVRVPRTLQPFIAAERDGSAFGLRSVTVSAPITYNSAHFGDVVLVASTGQILSRFASYVTLLVLVCLASVAASGIVMRRLKERMSSAESQLAWLANTDPLTHLPNRRAFYDELGTRLGVPVRQRTPLTLMLVDLDNFKIVNDTLGHGAGDELLGAVARELKAAVGRHDLVSRIGGDEFAILAVDRGSAQRSAALAARVVEHTRRAFRVADVELHVSASVGYSRYPDDAQRLADLVSSADTALYVAKSQGKGQAVAFRPEMTEAAKRRARLERELREALNTDAFYVVYQPKFSCGAGATAGVEALARWHHPLEGEISPAEFIAVAEMSDLIATLGLRVLETACNDIARLNRDTGVALEVSVNVSARQFRHPQFAEHVFSALRASGLDSSLLELELTESMLMTDVDDSVRLLREFQSHGVSVSIDDFGTGYSSLSYLRTLPIDLLKIDRSFVKSLPREGKEIVKAIISMAHSFGLEVVAEGVETWEQFALLRDIGCDLVQGYLTGRPVRLEVLTADIVREKANLPHRAGREFRAVQRGAAKVADGMPPLPEQQSEI
ncbi:putative bifunctional diguanylate cyclase/phosphodiesterase [Paraburkholderia kururiensis]|uniref:EAL domain-containing protein n=1 Tax=Paraburkholderia kururiensis TaxID=984307 RepID=A0ABZ0WMG4_9BURK|nr:EAL domain-containing protein [Paraburkholderia kururiensis]WQD78548.1 EAL domain-containing protein [Paraburkholderia kururiensis]